MRIDGVSNLYPPHRPLPIGGDAFDAPPGAIPFARFLQAQNQIDRAEIAGPVTPAATTDPSPAPRTQDFVTYAPASRANRAPWAAARLGDITPVEPMPKTPPVAVQQVVQVPGPTGRAIDLVV